LTAEPGPEEAERQRRASERNAGAFNELAAQLSPDGLEALCEMAYRRGPVPEQASLEQIGMLLAAERESRACLGGDERADAWLARKLSEVQAARGVTLAQGFLDQQLRGLDERLASVAG
jgi:hypothetical protein